MLEKNCIMRHFIILFLTKYYETKLKRRWVGYVASMEEVRNACRMSIKHLKGTDHLEELAIDGKIILE